MTPTGDLHDISYQIGQIKSEIENARRSREVTHTKLEAIERRFDELAGLALEVRRMAPEVQHYADARRRLAGAVMVLTILAGGLGAGLQELLRFVLHR